MQKREKAITFKGNPVTLVGPQLKVGDKAPDFRCLTSALAPVGIADTPAKPRLFSVVPYTVSLDLPFAQKRFCAAEGCSNMQTLSDVHNHSFGESYGVLIEGLPLPLLARAVFVVDGAGTIKHAEYVSEVTAHPDYEKAIAALKSMS